MRVLVTDGENRATLAITRSLGRLGHEVIVGEKHTPSLAQASRYCAGRFVYPDPVLASDQFVDHLIDVVHQRRIDVLLPVADITTMLVTAHRGRFEASCAIPFAKKDTIARAAHKVDLVRTAMRLGVPVPRSIVIADPDVVPDLDLGFPVVIKPHQSRLRTADGWASTGVSYASDADDLIRDLRARPRHEYPVMLQERLVGPGMGVFALYDRGKPIALFSHRRIRERPPWGGVSVLSESVPMCPHAREYATRLLDDLEWHGVAMVEFKRDNRDGVPKLMEINGRFWGSLQLAIDAGVDFPALLVGTTRCAAVDPQASYRLAIRTRWFWGDVDSLLLTLFGRSRAPGALPDSRLRAVFDFAKLWGRRLHYDNPKLYDVQPWLFETYRRFRPTVANGVPRLPLATRFVPSPPLVDVPAVDLKRHARVAASLEDTGLDEHGWNALVAQSDTNSVFQTHQWTRSWWSTFGSRYEPCFVMVSDGPNITTVAPLMVDRSSGVRILRFVGDGRADYCDVLTSIDKAQAVAVVCEAIRSDPSWDVIELNNMPAASATPGLVSAFFKRAGFPTQMTEQFVCPTLAIAGHEQAALEIFNKPSLRRRQSYFEKHGRLTFRTLTTAPEVEPHLDAFFAQHVARWAGSSSPSLFVEPRNQKFYRTLTNALSDTGYLLFSAIEYDGRPLAFHYGFDYNGSVIWYKPSFDPGQSAHSPGLVMVRHLIGYAIDRQRRELDFTVGNEEFKRRFTNNTRRTVQVKVFRGVRRFLLERTRRMLAARLKDLS